MQAWLFPKTTNDHNTLCHLAIILPNGTARSGPGLLIEREHINFRIARLDDLVSFPSACAPCLLHTSMYLAYLR